MSSFGVQQPHTFRRSRPHWRELPYLLFLPSAYAVHPQRWPLMLFLHGAGERGNDLQRVKRHGVAKIVEEQPEFPLVVVSPQCPPREAWAPEPLLALLDDIEQHYDIDPERRYVTGLSMGGFGTWAVALAAPDRFAAVAPICGAAILLASASSGTSRCGRSMARAILLSRCNGPWRWSRRYDSVGETSGSRSIPRQATMRGRRRTPTPSCTPGSSRTHEGQAPEAGYRCRAEPRTA